MPTLPKGWGDQSDDDPEFLMYDSHRLRQIGVVTDNYGAFHGTPMGIVYEMSCQVDIRSLLLRPQDSHKAFSIGSRKQDRVGQELTENNLNGWESAKGSEVRVLPSRLVGVGGPALHPCREVLDGSDVVSREEPSAEANQVEPLEGCAPQASVVEVESIDVHDGPHLTDSGAEIKLRPTKGPASRPPPEGEGGVVM